MQKTIDLRSDTVTKANQEMRQAMAQADVGDALMGEDPTVNLLEAKIANFFGFSFGAFVPTGTMSNQILLRALSEPGDAILAPKTNHIIHFESGALAALGGLQTIAADSADLTHVDANSLAHFVTNEKEFYRPPLKIVAIENTSMAAAGKVYSAIELEKLFKQCQNHSLYLHIDGARIWHAIDCATESASFIGKHSHSLSVCLSKGLGAPVGSVALVHNETHFKRLKRFQKMYGGCMRQAGHLAAAGIYAFEQNRRKLPETHALAEHAAQVFQEKFPQSKVHFGGTNIVLIESFDADKIVSNLKSQQNVLLSKIGSNIARAVFHIDMIESDFAKRLASLKV